MILILFSNSAHEAWLGFYHNMRIIFLTLMFFAAFDTHAGDPVEIVLNDPWRADPYTDALEVIEFGQPYLLQLQVMGIAECARIAG